MVIVKEINVIMEESKLAASIQKASSTTSLVESPLLKQSSEEEE